MSVIETKAQAASKLSSIGVSHLIEMFDLLPNTLFWIKDENCRFLHVNKIFVEHSGLGCISKVIGKTDYAISPPHLARQYMLDDKKVMEGHIVTDRIELNHLTTGEFGWFSTSKRPIYDENELLIGSYGLTHYLEQTVQALSSIAPVRAPVEYIRQNYHLAITMDELAGLACLSLSALERRFKKYLGKTPKQFINEVRLENARRQLVETKLPIIEVAFRCGFREHSYFSKQFKAMFGLLPSQVREQQIPVDEKV